MLRPIDGDLGHVAACHFAEEIAYEAPGEGS